MYNFNEKEMYYFEYIMEHKLNIMIAYNLLSNAHLYATTNNWGYVSDDEMRELQDRVLLHDLSKFEPNEFRGYRENFYLEEGEKPNKEGFEKAWRNHYINNKHHPENHTWRMDSVSTLEMCLDWTAMSIKFGGCPKEYFENKRSKLEKEFIDVIDFKRVEDIINALAVEVKRYREVDNLNIFDESKNWSWRELK